MLEAPVGKLPGGQTLGLLEAHTVDPMLLAAEHNMQADCPMKG